jgi:hypothetical protein
MSAIQQGCGHPIEHKIAHEIAHGIARVNGPLNIQLSRERLKLILLGFVVVGRIFDNSARAKYSLSADARKSVVGGSLVPDIWLRKTVPGLMQHPE